MLRWNLKHAYKFTLTSLVMGLVTGRRDRFIIFLRAVGMVGPAPLECRGFRRFGLLY